MKIKRIKTNKSFLRISTLGLIPLCLTLLITGCLTPQSKEITQITYRFLDASVPPEYHRSFEITVSKEAITLTVDSYGDILVKKTFPSSPEKLESFSGFKKRYNLKNRPFVRNSGCTGGTGEEIIISYSDGSRFKGRVYHCGGRDTGDLTGDTRAAGKEVKSLIPGLADYLE